MGMNQLMGKVEIPVQQVIDVVSRRAAVYEILDKQGKQGTPLLMHALPRALARARALSFSLSSLSLPFLLLSPSRGCADSGAPSIHPSLALLFLSLCLDSEFALCSIKCAMCWHSFVPMHLRMLLRTCVRVVRGCAHTRAPHTHTFSHKTNTHTHSDWQVREGRHFDSRSRVQANMKSLKR
jgi:hypothetical protein